MAFEVGINSGWANNCGTELFTLGWVQCGTTTVEERRAGGYDAFRGHDSYLVQAMREDEEVIILFKSFIEVINANRLY